MVGEVGSQFELLSEKFSPTKPLAILKLGIESSSTHRTLSSLLVDLL